MSHPASYGTGLVEGTWQRVSVCGPRSAEAMIGHLAPNPTCVMRASSKAWVDFGYADVTSMCPVRQSAGCSS